MGSDMLQLLILGAVAVFLVMRLLSVLGTRDGFEPGPDAQPTPARRKFEVIEGGVDHDIADHADIDSDTGQALTAMKRIEHGFSVTEFVSGARQAYEMILMAFEKGDREFLEQLLAPDIYEGFVSVIDGRDEKGLTVEATFIGVREISIKDAKFDADENEGEVTFRFVGEMTSVVKDEDGKVVEGNPDEIKRQTDVWTFARLMGTDNPNWLLVATTE